MDNIAVAIPLRDLIIFPGAMRAVAVGRKESVASIEMHLNPGVPLVLVAQLDPEQIDPIAADISAVGVLAQVLRTTAFPDGTMRVLIEGLQRVHIRTPVTLAEGVLHVAADPVEPPPENPIELSALALNVAEMFGAYMAAQGLHDHEHELIAAPVTNPGRVADQIASQLALSPEEKLQLLEEVSAGNRLHMLTELLTRAAAKHRIEGEINDKVTAILDKNNREFHLREQLKVVREELGDRASPDADADRFAERLKALGMPEQGLEEALREVERLRRVHVDTAEHTIIRTWLETLCDVPWQISTSDTTDLPAALAVLDEDHYGLEKVKERILEYLAVRQLNPKSKGAVLCLIGPPGVGKTSLGSSIARALGRSFGRIALGGVKDETEIRGHRRTYVGAMPGRILRAMIRAKSNNPVLMLDELDKVGADPHRGDPSSALLEVLDSEQNGAFTDHYLDIPIDLSQVMFIATANLENPIPAALHDRLEIIHITGYIEEEKVKIAQRHLIELQTKAHGFAEGQLTFTRGALQNIVRNYTREAGVRELDRVIATVHRKVARRIVEGKATNVKIGSGNLKPFLGPAKYFMDIVDRVDQPGVCVGLAWTSVGGDILFIEATRMPGKRSLKLTGSLGDVMKESVETAMSWLRTNGHRYDIDAAEFESEFHIHVPAGAIPKDGPSAGVAMVIALASLVTGRNVPARLAMTGEITLRGKVLPVGGVKEKVLAARRAGVTRVILPRQNETDLDDIPLPLRRELSFVFVDAVDQVIEAALMPKAD